MAVLVSFIGGVALTVLVVGTSSNESMQEQADSNDPLYWVAPMDANYKRDKPGKSPMGMDLVPVYDKGGAGMSNSPGIVSINPNVINNLSVRTGVVSENILVNKINTVGYVQYDEESLTHLHPRSEGWIEKLYVHYEGQFIEKDEPVYSLYSPVLVNAQEEYLLAKQRNNSRLLRAAKQRLSALNFDKKELSKMNQRGRPLQEVVFYASSSGVVDNLNVREGFYIMPDTRLMTIGQLDTVWVDVEVFEKQLPFVEKGQKAVMKLGYLPSKEWVGTVDYVYPMINSTNRAAKVRLEFDNPEHTLKPNMFADITIDTKTKAPVLQVPIEAVIRTELNDRVVMSMDNGQFKSVSVKTGRVTSDSIEILSGLKEDDKIVLSGQFLIDSESSIDSDFKRFSDGMSMDNQIQNTMQDDEPPMATVKGIINDINLENRVINISRQEIPKWNRGPATLDFTVAESIDIATLKAGEDIRFTFEIVDGDFVIIQLHNGNMEHQND